MMGIKYESDIYFLVTPLPWMVSGSESPVLEGYSHSSNNVIPLQHRLFFSVVSVMTVELLFV